MSLNDPTSPTLDKELEDLEDPVHGLDLDDNDGGLDADLQRELEALQETVQPQKKKRKRRKKSPSSSKPAEDDAPTPKKEEEKFYNPAAVKIYMVKQQMKRAREERIRKQKKDQKMDSRKRALIAIEKKARNHAAKSQKLAIKKYGAHYLKKRKPFSVSKPQDEDLEKRQKKLREYGKNVRKNRAKIHRATLMKKTEAPTLDRPQSAPSRSVQRKLALPPKRTGEEIMNSLMNEFSLGSILHSDPLNDSTDTDSAMSGSTAPISPEPISEQDRQEAESISEDDIASEAIRESKAEKAGKIAAHQQSIVVPHLNKAQMLSVIRNASKKLKHMESRISQRRQKIVQQNRSPRPRFPQSPKTKQESQGHRPHTADGRRSVSPPAPRRQKPSYSHRSPVSSPKHSPKQSPTGRQVPQAWQENSPTSPGSENSYQSHKSSAFRKAQMLEEHRKLQQRLFEQEEQIKRQQLEIQKAKEREERRMLEEQIQRQRNIKKEWEKQERLNKLKAKESHPEHVSIALKNQQGNMGKDIGVQSLGKYSKPKTKRSSKKTSKSPHSKKKRSKSAKRKRPKREKKREKKRIEMPRVNQIHETKLQQQRLEMLQREIMADSLVQPSPFSQQLKKPIRNRTSSYQKLTKKKKEKPAPEVDVFDQKRAITAADAFNLINILAKQREESERAKKNAIRLALERKKDKLKPFKQKASEESIVEPEENDEFSPSKEQSWVDKLKKEAGMNEEVKKPEKTKQLEELLQISKQIQKRHSEAADQLRLQHQQKQSPVKEETQPSLVQQEAPPKEDSPIAPPEVVQKSELVDKSEDAPNRAIQKPQESPVQPAPVQPQQSQNIAPVQPQSTTPLRKKEPRLSPESLENKLKNAMNLYDSTQESRLKLELLEKQQEIAKANQEAVSLAQILKHQQQLIENQQQEIDRQKSDSQNRLKQLELDRKAQEERERSKQLELEKKLQAEEAKRKEAEEKRKQAEEKRLRAEEEKKRAEEEKRRAEEEKQRLQSQSKRDLKKLQQLEEENLFKEPETNDGIRHQELDILNKQERAEKRTRDQRLALLELLKKCKPEDIEVLLQKEKTIKVYYKRRLNRIAERKNILETVLRQEQKELEKQRAKLKKMQKSKNQFDERLRSLEDGTTQATVSLIDYDSDGSTFSMLQDSEDAEAQKMMQEYEYLKRERELAEKRIREEREANKKKKLADKIQLEKQKLEEQKALEKQLNEEKNKLLNIESEIQAHDLKQQEMREEISRLKNQQRLKAKEREEQSIQEASYQDSIQEIKEASIQEISEIKEGSIQEISELKEGSIPEISDADIIDESYRSVQNDSNQGSIQELDQSIQDLDEELDVFEDEIEEDFDEDLLHESMDEVFDYSDHKDGTPTIDTSFKKKFIQEQQTAPHDTPTYMEDLMDDAFTEEKIEAMRANMAEDVIPPNARDASMDSLPEPGEKTPIKNALLDETKSPEEPLERNELLQETQENIQDVSKEQKEPLEKNDLLEETQDSIPEEKLDTELSEKNELLQETQDSIRDAPKDNEQDAPKENELLDSTVPEDVNVTQDSIKDSNPLLESPTEEKDQSFEIDEQEIDESINESVNESLNDSVKSEGAISVSESVPEEKVEDETKSESTVTSRDTHFIEETDVIDETGPKKPSQEDAFDAFIDKLIHKTVTDNVKQALQAEDQKKRSIELEKSFRQEIIEDEVSDKPDESLVNRITQKVTEDLLKDEMDSIAKIQKGKKTQQELIQKSIQDQKKKEEEAFKKQQEKEEARRRQRLIEEEEERKKIEAALEQEPSDDELIEKHSFDQSFDDSLEKTLEEKEQLEDSMEEEKIEDEPKESLPEIKPKSQSSLQGLPQLVEEKVEIKDSAQYLNSYVTALLKDAKLDNHDLSSKQAVPHLTDEFFIEREKSFNNPEEQQIVNKMLFDCVNEAISDFNGRLYKQEKQKLFHGHIFQRITQKKNTASTILGRSHEEKILMPTIQDTNLLQYVLKKLMASFEMSQKEPGDFALIEMLSAARSTNPETYQWNNFDDELEEIKIMVADQIESCILRDAANEILRMDPFYH